MHLRFEQDTQDIVNANCSPETSGDLIAGNAAANYSHGGYSDWFLPSKDELNQLYHHQDLVGGLVASDYWSSSEYSGSPRDHAWIQRLSDGNQFDGYKPSDFFYVRPVREF